MGLKEPLDVLSCTNCGMVVNDPPWERVRFTDQRYVVDSDENDKEWRCPNCDVQSPPLELYRITPNRPSD